MARSTIKTLPPALLAQLQDWLRDPTISQQEATERLNDLLEELGEKPRSKSAVNRYAVEMAEIGKEIEESRAVAKMLMGKLGNEPQGEVGRLINEMVRNLIFKLSMSMSKNDYQPDAKELKELATAIEKLEKATTINEKRQREIEEAALAKAADDMEKAAKSQGVSDDTIAILKNKFLNPNT